MLGQDRFGNAVLLTTVEMKTILDALRNNRALHNEAYIRADAAYKAAYIKATLALHDEAVAWTQGKGPPPDPKRVTNLRRPVSHVQEYDDLIAQLNVSTNAELTLTQEMFQRYMLDRWEWKPEFHQTVSSYIDQGVEEIPS